MPARKALKRDALGAISVAERDGAPVIVRDTTVARWGARWLARLGARREAAALRVLESIEGVPRLVSFDGRILYRTFLPGEPLHRARPRTPAYYRQALRLLRRVHAQGVAHDDLAKEANWLCTSDNRPALVDFQLAWISQRRGRLFRLLAREDLRHLLKHKRTYVPAALTARQRALLGSPTWPARAWRALAKPVYLAVTRGVLGWGPRKGPAERGSGGE